MEKCASPLDASLFDCEDRNKSTESQDIDDPLLCGFGSCTPGWLQKFHNAKCLLLILGMAAFIQSFVVNAIFPVGLSTLEKRFGMTSTHTGIISSWYDFAVLLVVFPMCHWGNSGHKGQWIGWGGVIMAAGSFICALPHWIVDQQDLSDGLITNSTDFGQCGGRDSDPMKCRHSTLLSYLNPYFLLFLLGQTLHGVGSTPLFSIGTTFIDENVSQKASPVYLAFHAVLTSFGPVIGVFAGGMLLNFHEDIDLRKTVPISNADPRWIGAWWIGFVLSSIAALIVAIPMLGFARELPEAKKHRAKDVNQCHASAMKEQKACREMKDLPKTVLNICRNTTFVTVVLVGIFESIVINGFAAFMPKILETLLSTTPTLASYLSSVVIFAAAAGVMFGGTVIRQLRLQVGGMLKVSIIFHIIALISTLGLLIHCPQRQFVGINLGYNDASIQRAHHHSLTETCNRDCHCKEAFVPVCQKQSGHIFYSACHAGCVTKTDSASSAMWSDCSCLEANSTFHDVAESFGDLQSGYCEAECGYAMYFLIGTLFISVVASFAAGIITQQIMLRVVPFEQRTLALGVNWTFARLLGFIPGGILFGMIIDTTCLHWDESCGKSNCVIYDPAWLAWILTTVAVVCKLLTILTTLMGYMTYRPSDVADASSSDTADSQGPLHLVVNDDRSPDQIAHIKSLDY